MKLGAKNTGRTRPASNSVKPTPGSAGLASKRELQNNLRNTLRGTEIGTAKQPGILQWSGIFRPTTMLLFLFLGFVLSSGLSVVNATHKNRFAFNELQELREQANRLDVEWGQLLIEQSTFGVEGRIEQKAVGLLQMQVPELNDIVMVRYD